MNHEEAWAAEYYDLNLQRRRIERRLEELGDSLKANTGERLAGKFLVNVASFTVERIDSDAVKAILGAKTPMKSSPTVRLTVVPA